MTIDIETKDLFNLRLVIHVSKELADAIAQGV